MYYYNFGKTKKILQSLIYINYLAETLPLILFLYFIKKNYSIDLKVFFAYTIMFVTLLMVTFYFKFIDNNPLKNLDGKRIFLLLEFIFLNYYFSFLIKSKLRFFISSTSVFLFILYSYYDYTTSVKGTFSFIPLVVECFYFIFIILFFFYETIRYNISKPLYSATSFWISVGFLIYFSGNFFLFLFSSVLSKDPQFRPTFTLIYNVVTIIKNIFLCTAIIVNAFSKDNNNKAPISNKIDVDLDTFNPFTKKTNLRLL